MPTPRPLLVVHPHFHGRRTGVTRHVESVVLRLGPRIDGRVVGASVDPALPRISMAEVVARGREEPVVWHAHRNNELAAGLALRRLAPCIRVIWTRHAAGRASPSTRLLSRQADHRVALTEESASYLKSPRTVIPHGVDTQRFSPPPDREAAWRELGVGGRFGVGVVGRIRPAKGQADFVAAVRPLLEARSEWRGVLLGRVKRRHRRWLDRLPLEPLRHVAEVPEVAPWYRGLTVVVQPSRSEGFSLVALEAMAAGCCVVAAALPHFPGLIEHGRDGFLYPPGKVDALRDVLGELMDDPARARRLGKAATRRVRERFGIDREAAALRALYLASVSGGPEPTGAVAEGLSSTG